MQLYPIISRVEEPNTFLTSSLPISTTLKAWYVGDNINYTIGGNLLNSASGQIEIVQWNDLSGNNHHISSSRATGISASCAYLSETPLHGHQGLSFMGASAMICSGAILSTTTTTVYAVVTAWSPSMNIFFNGKGGATVGTSNGWGYYLLNSGLNPAIVAFGVTTANFTTANISMGSPSIIAFTRSASTHAIYVNGYGYTTVSASPTAASGFTGLGNINTDQTGGSSLSHGAMTMYELMAFDALHTSAQITQMSVFLGRKYGIPVSFFT